MNSPVSLGVSLADAPAPTGVFNQRFEALFPRTGALGCEVCFAPLLFLPVYLFTNVGPQGLLAVSLPAVSSTIRHLSGYGSCHPTESPLCPSCHFRPSCQSG